MSQFKISVSFSFFKLVLQTRGSIWCCLVVILSMFLNKHGKEVSNKEK